LFFKTEIKYDTKVMFLIKLRKFAGRRNYKAKEYGPGKIKGSISSLKFLLLMG